MVSFVINNKLLLICITNLFSSTNTRFIFAYKTISVTNGSRRFVTSPFRNRKNGRLKTELFRTRKMFGCTKRHYFVTKQPNIFWVRNGSVTEPPLLFCYETERLRNVWTPYLELRLDKICSGLMI